MHLNSFIVWPSLSSNLHDEDLVIYGEYFENMYEDMKTWFSHVLMMDIPTWVSIPFEANISDIHICH